MDPSFSIDLKTVGGIVALTIMLVHGLKGWLANVPLLEKVPVSAYVVLVSMILTLLSRDVLHLIGGDRGELLMQAFIQALVASGAVEWWRAGAKPLDESARAQDVTMKRSGLYLVPILLAVGLTVGCASTGKILVEVDRGIHATVTGIDDVGTAACDLQLRTAADCQAFNAALVTAYSAYENFNRGVREGSTAAVPSMIDALTTLRDAAIRVAPQASLQLADLKRLIAHLGNLVTR